MAGRSRPAAFVVAAALALAGCKGAPQPQPDEPAPSFTTVPVDPRSVRFSLISFDLDAAATPSPGHVDDVRNQVLALLDTYLRVATLDPVITGGPVGDLAPVFTAAALPRVTGPDRASLVDEGLPRLSDPKPTAAVGLRALVGTEGELAVVAALVDIRVDGEIDREPLTVTRQGTLVLVDEGGWKIDGYELTVKRNTGGPPPATP